ncbi:hypothetical protein KXD40_004318 [Peronospora effusa]|uniref:Uncharacterized protein n=1 Tax=Peronospora effusa TaxID=542832 RepID=A0A3M6VIV7_9STRA|nr:hypothetical protein DD238_004688 [Peronospora effusa]RQM13536.1 hypothetical protein DD237_006568 [Peronospora effusa]UIZ28348.1 hypothetical protein KXD40_004318 [Peronospora effusa]CAI5701080.1 unnamed protein product [Peronospora effusa]
MTYTTAISAKSTEVEKRVNSTRSICSSPSSISDVGFSCSSTDRVPLASNKVDTTTNNVKSGDELEQPEVQDGMDSLASGSIDINDALAHPLSSSESLKRKSVEDVDETQDQVTKKLKTEQLTPAEADSDYLPTDIEEDEEENVYKSSVSHDDCTAVVGCRSVEMNAAADVTCSSETTRRYSRRTLYIEYWSRTNECKERKWDHLDEIAENYGSAEEHIFATTLKDRSAFLEPNMFPYNTPAGIEHWTLWHIKDLNHDQVKQYVESWIDANASHVERWNYDDNPERSIDIFHVHVYFQVAEGLTVLHDRKVENLMHEFD